MHSLLAALQAAQRPSPLLSLGDVITEYVGFLGWFGIFGALGFRFAVLRAADAPAALGRRTAPKESAGLYAAAERGAARVGVIGAFLFLVDLVAGLARRAAEKHMTLTEAATRAGSRFVVPVVLGALLLLLFGAALRRVRWAWAAAAVLAAVLVLRDIVTLRWLSLVNPLHETAASLWIGTLFVVVAAGLPAVLRGGIARERRGPLAAEMVARFSLLALGAASVLVLTGVITAWVHLKYLSALWTTPYGWTLIAKLCVVAVVAGLGAWNWRRMTPRLGAEESAHALRRSATAELTVAAVVLVLTAVLVSLPTPKLPHG